MITDLFNETICRICGSRRYRRLERLILTNGVDFLCICEDCGTLFSRAYERQVQNG